MLRVEAGYAERALEAFRIEEARVLDREPLATTWIEQAVHENDDTELSPNAGAVHSRGSVWDA